MRPRRLGAGPGRRRRGGWCVLALRLMFIVVVVVVVGFAMVLCSLSLSLNHRHLGFLHPLLLARSPLYVGSRRVIASRRLPIVDRWDIHTRFTLSLSLHIYPEHKHITSHHIPTHPTHPLTTPLHVSSHSSVLFFVYSSLVYFCVLCCALPFLLRVFFLRPPFCFGDELRSAGLRWAGRVHDMGSDGICPGGGYGLWVRGFIALSALLWEFWGWGLHFRLREDGMGRGGGYEGWLTQRTARTREWGGKIYPGDGDADGPARRGEGEGR